jgi:tripartite-type tricarboxylate transporter receptor subunit TctC
MTLSLTKTALLATAAIVLVPLSAQAEAVADFYKGKQISVYIGFTAGGGYDAYARLVSKHMGNHIPGSPVMVPKNMAGAGSRKATAYIYNVAPKDGTSIATADQSQALQQAMEDPSIKFDVRKLIWIGNPNKDVNTLAVWHTSGIKTLNDAKKREVVVGATGSNTSAQYPQAMNYFLGTKFKIINGYPGGNDINLAMERGEVQARAFSMSSIVSQHPDWIKEKKVAFLAQVGTRREKDIPDVPLATELAKTDEQRAILKLISAPPALGQPYLTPPGVPEERVAVLRKAFMATLHDKGFLADAAKSEFDIDAMDADEVARIVDDTIGAPAAIVAKAKAAMESPDAQPQGKAASKP